MAEAIVSDRLGRALRIRLRLPVILVLALFGCGDDGSHAVGTTEGGSVTGATSSSSSDSGAPSSSSSTTSESTTNVEPVTTSSASTGPGRTTGSSDDGGTWQTTTDCGFTCPNPPGGGAGPCQIGGSDCPEGNKCMPWANDGGVLWNATKCVPLDPDPDGPGEVCRYEGSTVSGVDSCGVGLWCGAGELETGEGLCVQLCGSPTLTCDSSERCVGSGSVPGFGVCAAECDPLAQACEKGRGCWPAGFGFGCQFALPYELQEGCVSDTACEPGEVCKPASEVRGCEHEQCCTAVCDLQDPSCATGQVCVDHGSPLSAYANVGYCQSQ